MGLYARSIGPPLGFLQGPIVVGDPMNRVEWEWESIGGVGGRSKGT